MKDLSLHILDILENSAKAGASEIRVTLHAQDDIFIVRIQDNGPGFPPEVEADPSDPWRTSRTDRKVGLGLSLLQAAAEQTGESVQIKPNNPSGVDVSATFNLSHVDAQPLGDLAELFCAAIMAWPAIDLYVCTSMKDSDLNEVLNSAEIRTELDGIPLHTPAVRKYLITALKEGLMPLQNWAHQVASSAAYK